MCIPCLFFIVPIPPADEIPPAIYTENHAQNEVTGDTGGIGGISLEDRPQKSLGLSFKKTVTSKGVNFLFLPPLNPSMLKIYIPKVIGSSYQV